MYMYMYMQLYRTPPVADDGASLNRSWWTCAGLGGKLTAQEVSVISGAIDLKYKTAISAMTPLAKVNETDVSTACALWEGCLGTDSAATATATAAAAAAVISPPTACAWLGMSCSCSSGSSSSSSSHKSTPKVRQRLRQLSAQVRACCVEVTAATVVALLLVAAAATTSHSGSVLSWSLQLTQCVPHTAAAVVAAVGAAAAQ
jgi:hypothetical protein